MPNCQNYFNQCHDNMTNDNRTNTHASHVWPVFAQVREEIEFENLAKMYLREMIKRECWDEMVVKGRAVQVRTCWNVFKSIFE